MITETPKFEFCLEPTQGQPSGLMPSGQSPNARLPFWFAGDPAAGEPRKYVIITESGGHIAGTYPPERDTADTGPK
jgi:hypothetical protein